MDDRNLNVLKLRPEIPRAKVGERTTRNESFQNKTLRPIAKLQNDILTEIFKNYIIKRKNVYHKLSDQKKQDYIEHAVKTDSKLRVLIQGIFIGLFTKQEYLEYLENHRALNKRITNLSFERIRSQMQLFERINDN